MNVVCPGESVAYSGGSQTSILWFMNGMPMERDWFAYTGCSIGIPFHYVEGIVEDSGVKPLALDGVRPDRKRIAEGSYPIIGDINAVYRRDDANPNIPRLIEWIPSEEGQRIVAESGYVPPAG